MTDPDRRFERIARAWLDLGPNEAPERAVAAALQAIDTTPQVRRAWRWPLRRDTPMTRLPLLAALVGLVILSIGALLLSGGGVEPAPAPDPTGTAVSSPTPTPIPTPTPSPAPVPETLVGGWVAAGRGFEPIAPGAMQVLTFGVDSGRLQAPAGTFDNGQPFVAGMDGTGALRLSTGQASTLCELGDVGTYSLVALGPAQIRLTPVEDDCEARSAIIDGIWHRSLSHPSRGGPGVAANFLPILEFTLPVGTYTGRGQVARDEIVIDSATATYKVWRDLDGFLDPCDIDQGRLLLDPGMDALLAYFEDDPRFDVQRREEFAIDGRRAVEIEIVIGAGLEEPCWTFDGDAGNRRGVLTWVPQAAPQGAFWNDQIGGRDTLVITEVDGIALMFEFLTFEGETYEVDRDTLSTVRFLDALPEAPAG